MVAKKRGEMYSMTPLVVASGSSANPIGCGGSDALMVPK